MPAHKLYMRKLSQLTTTDLGRTTACKYCPNLDLCYYKVSSWPCGDLFYLKTINVDVIDIRKLKYPILRPSSERWRVLLGHCLPYLKRYFALIYLFFLPALAPQLTERAVDSGQIRKDGIHRRNQVSTHSVHHR